LVVFVMFPRYTGIRHTKKECADVFNNRDPGDY